MRTAMSLLFMFTLAAAGCKKKEAEKAPDPVPAAADAAQPADAAAADAAPSGDATAAGEGEKMSKRGGNCPSMVAGVTTTATADDKVVTVTVTAADADAIASIQKRSAELLAEKEDPAAGKVHDQKGTYGGAMGLCPVGTNGATAAMEKTAKGVAIVLTPSGGGTVAELKAKVDERIKASNEYVAANIKPGDEGTGGAVGGGKGDHGSNHSGKGDGKGKSDGTGGGSGAGTGGGGKEKTK